MIHCALIIYDHVWNPCQFEGLNGFHGWVLFDQEYISFQPPVCSSISNSQAENQILVKLNTHLIIIKI